jgi:hypothetical protein
MMKIEISFLFMGKFVIASPENGLRKNGGHSSNIEV